MWKEAYRVGIDSIDQQHIELFRQAEQLMGAINSHTDKEKFKEIIAFLKEYVVKHFHDEEEYQASIHYPDIESHKAAHRDFTNMVLEYEKKLTISGYSLSVVKELAGILTAWLIYHVADADQKIAGKAITSVSNDTTYLSSFLSGAFDVLEKMAGLNSKSMEQSGIQGGTVSGDIFVKIGLVSGDNKDVIFGFSKELAFKLTEIMTSCAPDSADELVCSMLGELANIASGNAATSLSQSGIPCDITTPYVTLQPLPTDLVADRTTIHTGIGELEIVIF